VAGAIINREDTLKMVGYNQSADKRTSEVILSDDSDRR